MTHKQLGALIILCVVLLFAYVSHETQKPAEVNETVVINPHDGTFAINHEKVTLVNGVSEVPAAPGSASKITTRYFGNDVKGDFNGDGREDIAFYITQETGGSGTFFYVVALLDTPEGKLGTDAAYVGDRIAPQNLNLKDGNIVVVNYVDRNYGESFAVQPSVGKSLYLKLDPSINQFGEVVQNFEGESR